MRYADVNYTSLDIANIMSRHNQGFGPGVKFQDSVPCARIQSLRDTAFDRDVDDRLAKALDTPCTCGAGDSESERKSIRLLAIALAEDSESGEHHGTIAGSTPADA